MTSFLHGKSERHLCLSAEAAFLGARIHRNVVEPFRNLQRDARAMGFELSILSGFRSFNHQLSIWNRKASGELAVLDGDALPLDVQAMGDRELVDRILRWSALPGASRHHWGTDLDIYDAATKPDGYEVELIPSEVNADGMFGALHEWLDTRIADGRSYGFFRPYDEDRRGVAPERWHLSYVPLAARYLEELTIDVLRAAITEADMRLRDTVLQHLEEIHARFVTNVNPAVRMRWTYNDDDDTSFPI